MASSKPGLFAREATGLVREIGFTLGVMIILCHVIGYGWQKRAFQFAGPKPMPTPDMPLGLPAMFWAFLIGGIVVLISGYAAGYVAAAMPRSGGGYVTISRVIHPFVGYMSGWLMWLAEAFSYGLIAAAVFEGIIVFYNIALATPANPSPIALDATTWFIASLVIVWIFVVLALLGTKLYGRLLQVMFYIPAAITIAFFAMWIAGAMDPGVVATGVENVMGKPPADFVQLALNTGMAEAAAKIGFFDAFSFALGGAFWAYMGWYATSFLAGEVKEANKKLPMVLLIAGLIIMIVYLLASSLPAIATLNVAVTPDGKWSFYQGYSWLSYAVDIDAVRAVIPGFQPAWSTGIASIIARGMALDWLSWLIALGGVFWIANDIPPFLLVASRTFFAMSFDRMLPEKFAYVSERWHAPVWSLIITGIVATLGIIPESNFADLGNYFLFAGVVATDMFDAFFLTMFCVSCMLLPLERKDIYDRAAVKHSIGAVVTLGFLASFGAAFCLLIFVKESPFIYAPITTGASAAELSNAAGFYICILSGILLYLYHMYRNTTRGVDMRTLYLSIPPE